MKTERDSEQMIEVERSLTISERKEKRFCFGPDFLLYMDCHVAIHRKRGKCLKVTIQGGQGKSSANNHLFSSTSVLKSVLIQAFTNPTKFR